MMSFETAQRATNNPVERSHMGWRKRVSVEGDTVTLMWRHLKKSQISRKS
jgi:hypothetical protein